MQSTYLEARTVEVLRPHSNAVKPPCPYAGSCGGCTLQTLEYGAQLAAKQERLALTANRAFGLEADIIQPIIGCDEPFGCASSSQCVLKHPKAG